VAQLRPRARAVAKELAAWRERTAAAENRPVGSTLSDVALVEMARRQPKAVGEFGAIRGVRPDLGRRRGDAVLAVIERARDAPPPELEEWTRLDPEPGDAPRIALCEALVRHRVNEAGLAYELVASRADLTAIAVAARERSDEPDVRTLRGWRRDLVGAELLDLLAGRVALRVQPGGGVAVERASRDR
jgi:ribonuclease D